MTFSVQTSLIGMLIIYNVIINYGLDEEESEEVIEFVKTINISENKDKEETRLTFLFICYKNMDKEKTGKSSPKLCVNRL